MNKIDPYDIHPMCYHRDALRRSSFTLHDGTVVEALHMYTGAEEPDKPEYIQFFGDVYQEIVSEGIDDNGFQWAELAVVRFNMTAKHPNMGELVISYDSSRPGNRATLRAVDSGRKFPAVHRTRMHVTATASTIPGTILQNQGAPLDFLSDQLDEWPPTESVYRLAVKVPFELRQKPGTIVVTSNAGAALVGEVK